jgi:hypothetical protein
VFSSKGRDPALDWKSTVPLLTDGRKEGVEGEWRRKRERWEETEGTKVRKGKC